MKTCCKHTKRDKKCIRKSDKKVFLAERYFKFLKRRTKIKDEKERKRLKFNIH